MAFLQAHFSLPVPLARRQDCDFSFAGLKTAVRYALIREHRASSQQSEQYSSPAPDTAAVTAASSDVLEVPGDCNTVGQESGRGGVEKGNMQARKSLNDFKGMKGVSTVPVSPSAAADMAWAFQNAATKHLQKRLDRAIQWLAAGKTMGAPGSRNPELVDAEPVTIRHVVVCGGVASNQHIRKELTETVEAHGYVAVLFTITHACTQFCSRAWSLVFHTHAVINPRPLLCALGVAFQCCMHVCNNFAQIQICDGAGSVPCFHPLLYVWTMV